MTKTLTINKMEKEIPKNYETTSMLGLCKTNWLIL